MYKFVKLLDSENDKLGQLGMAQLKAGTYDPATFDMTHEDEAMIKFADTRVWFRKVGTMRGAQTPVAALKNGYITREASNKRKGAFALRVEQDKGLALIDGIPFFRPGLWKAWYDAHGWLLTVLPASIIGSLTIIGLKSAWHHLT
jgi:hypothetical protein